MKKITIKMESQDLDFINQGLQNIHTFLPRFLTKARASLITDPLISVLDRVNKHRFFTRSGKTAAITLSESQAAALYILLTNHEWDMSSGYIGSYSKLVDAIDRHYGFSRSEMEFLKRNESQSDAKAQKEG